MGMYFIKYQLATCVSCNKDKWKHIGFLESHLNIRWRPTVPEAHSSLHGYWTVMQGSIGTVPGLAGCPCQLWVSFQKLVFIELSCDKVDWPAAGPWVMEKEDHERILRVSGPAVAPKSGDVSPPDY